MRVQSDNKQAGKQAVSTQLMEKSRESGTTASFVDNRPEIVMQRKLQARADNSAHVKQLKAMQELSAKHTANQQIFQRKGNDTLVTTKSGSGPVIQCKPKNIKKSHKLKLNKAGVIQNAEAARADVAVSYPMNTLSGLHIINHEDVTGGHLFKREYGGADNYSNVVTWNDRSEAAYTIFENDYLDKTRAAALAGDKAVTYNVETEANFGSSDVTKAQLFPGPKNPDTKDGENARHKIWELTKLALETVPGDVGAGVKELPEVAKFSRSGSKMLNTKPVPSAAAAQTQVNNIIAGVPDASIDRALERLKSP